MKLPANSSYIGSLIDGQRQFIIAHLYTFTTPNGTQDFFTDLDVDVLYGGNVYKSGGLRIQGLRMKLAIGISVDEQEVVIWASPTDTLFGAAFLTGMAEGLMDGGTIARDRIVWTNQSGDVALDIQQPPAAVWRMFLGYMSTIEKLGRASVSFKVKSPLVKLNTDMPRNFYQPGCLWSLFDQGCGLDRSNFTTVAVVSANPTLTRIPLIGGITAITGADGLPYWQRGRLVFDTGVNANLEVTIDTNDDQALYLAYPLNVAPNNGDTITIFPGCSKSFVTCQVKFNNINNFRGFDKVPPVFVSV